MKKALKVTGRILLGLLLMLLAALAILFVYNRIKLSQEEELLKGYPGELIEVNEHKMNVLAEGAGEHTLVFLAPAGDTSPMITFEPLYSELKNGYRIAVVEKFGYGMSDIVDTERDYELMVEECREALSKAGVSAPYILCPYSKSGLDTLIWAQKHPDEVEAIISIDMAVPQHFDAMEISAADMSWLMDIAKESGIGRLIVTDDMFPEDYTDEERETAKALVMRKYGNRDNYDEIARIPAACDVINSGGKPQCPMLMFLTKGTADLDPEVWRGSVYSYTEGLDAKYIEFDCSHNEIVGKEAEEMIKEIGQFTEHLDEQS